jgi:hypothetical protein
MWNFSWVPRSANCTTLLSCDRLDDLNRPRLAPPQMSSKIVRAIVSSVFYFCHFGRSGTYPLLRLWETEFSITKFLWGGEERWPCSPSDQRGINLNHNASASEVFNPVFQFSYDATVPTRFLRYAVQYIRSHRQHFRPA